MVTRFVSTSTFTPKLPLLWVLVKPINKVFAFSFLPVRLRLLYFNACAGADPGESYEDSHEWQYSLGLTIDQSSSKRQGERRSMTAGA